MNNIKVWKGFGLLILLLFFGGGIQGYLIYYGQKSFLISFFLSLLIVSPLAFLFIWYFIQPIKEMIIAIKRLIVSQLHEYPKIFGPDEFGKQMREIFNMVSEQKKQTAEIAKEKKYLEAVLNGIGEGVLVADASGHILRINAALRQLLSLPANAQAQIPLEIIRHVELEEAIKRTIQDGQNRSFEFTPPLGQRTFRVNVVGFYPSSTEEKEEEEQNRGAIAIFHDITRLKELERIRQDFVANVSHELRTPLTTIKGYAETLLDGSIKEEVAEQFVQVIKKHTDRLIKIAEDLLTLSKVESKEFQLQTEEILLLEFIEEVLVLVKEMGEKKKIKFWRQDLRPSLSVVADRYYLELVFLNLLDNAIKYSPEGGVIRIITKVQDEEYAQVTIQDEGVGIPPEDLSRIFERFYRVEKGRSKEYEGTGLGLSIVKHIIQAHHGKVWAESELGKGSAFHFTLPLKLWAVNFKKLV
ncbi:MAG: sensor histidine kinase [Thermodesulfobacteriota bacterium]